MTTQQTKPDPRPLIAKAMRDSDHWALQLEYEDSQGVRTRRVVSPIRFTSQTSFLALCLGREEPRRFDIDRCVNFALKRSEDCLMPEPIVELENEPNKKEPVQ